MGGTTGSVLWLELLSKVQKFYSKQTYALSKQKIMALKFIHTHWGEKQMSTTYIPCFKVFYFYNHVIYPEPEMKIRSYTLGFV